MAGLESMFGNDSPETEPTGAAPAADESQRGTQGIPEAPAPSAPPADAATPPVQTAAPTPPAQPQPHDQLVSALTEERARRREVQEQNQRLQTRLDEIEARIRQSQAAQQQQQQIPSYDDNPAEHLRALHEQAQAKIRELDQRLAGHDQRTQVVDQHTQFVSAVSAAESDFAARTPDYHVATQFVQQRKLTEYKAVGLNDIEARQALARDTMAIAQLAFQRGQNPAELMYTAAKALGFSAPAPQAPQAQRPPVAGSLQSTGGAAGADNTGMPTPEALSTMSDAEFDAWWNKMAQASAGARLQ